jgi:hypothetical protein
MSGAPVLDLETNKVVGLVSEHWITTGNVDTRLNFAIPLESITEVCPILKEKNSGLKKINTFMEAIGKRGSLLYDKFEDVYVLPIEYNEIEERLKESRCVFITGTAEYGKTYTAIKLLWEYYKSGYKPKYIEEGSSKEATDIIKKLINLDKKSLENSIIYFEDPVGKTKYEPNKEFEEYIGSIISGLDRLDMYLIVTMREEIYKEFDPIEKKRIGEYVNKLNIGKRSYNYEKRKEMLLRWASLVECN